MACRTGRRLPLLPWTRRPSLALRGNWTDPQTFVLEYNGVTTNDQMVLQFNFQDDRVEVTVSETFTAPGMEFEGRRQEP